MVYILSENNVGLDELKLLMNFCCYESSKKSTKEVLFKEYFEIEKNILKNIWIYIVVIEFF